MKQSKLYVSVRKDIMLQLLVVNIFFGLIIVLLGFGVGYLFQRFFPESWEAFGEFIRNLVNTFR